MAVVKKDSASSSVVKPPKKRRSETTQNKIYRLIGEVDRPMLIVIIALVCIGSVMVFSASYAVADSRFGDSYYFARSQILWVLIAFSFMTYFTHSRFFDYRLFKNIAYFFYVVVLGLNYMVPYFGVTVSGATRWFVIFGVQFQPSELLKFALVLALSTYISNNASKMNDFKNGVFPLLLLAAPAALATFLQNHLSATIIMLLLTFTMLWLSGVKRSYFGVVIGSGGLLALVVFATGLGRWLIEKFVPHALIRLQVWENPFAYMSYESGGKGWQPAQSLYAISSGGFWGLGLGQSNQKHGYLPEPQNDYIFAILCEELGFFGVVCVITLFGVLAYRGYCISKNAPNRFCSLLTMGITSQVIIQVMLNLAVVSNTLPSTGISLPFFSYGGTSLLILLIEMGVVLSISRFSYIEQG